MVVRSTVSRAVNTSVRSTLGSGGGAAGGGGRLYDAATLDWETRVIANSGTVSTATKNAVDDFVLSAKSAGYWDKINRVNLWCGDGLASVAVPLLVGDGGTLDTLTGIVAGDYTESTGLGGGAGKTVDTGLTMGALGRDSNTLVYFSCSESSDGYSRVLFGYGVAGSGATNGGSGSLDADCIFARNNSGGVVGQIDGQSKMVGVFGTRRSSSANFDLLANYAIANFTATSSTPPADTIHFLSRNGTAVTQLDMKVGGYVAASALTNAEYFALVANLQAFNHTLGRLAKGRQRVDFRPTTGVHVPHLTRINASRILLHWMNSNGSHVSLQNELKQAVSTDGGKSWKDIKTIFTAASGKNLQPGGLIKRDNGELWWFVAELNNGNSYEITLKYAASTDDGITWGALQNVAGFANFNQFGDPIEIDGTVFVPVHQRATIATSYTLHVLTTTDGTSWSKIDIGLSGETQLVEPTLVEWDSGILMLIRHQSDGRIWYSFSSDGGTTWSAAAQTNIVAPDTRSMCEVLANGNLAIIHNNNASSRIDLTITEVSARSGGTFTVAGTTSVASGWPSAEKVQYGDIAVNGGDLVIAYAYERTGIESQMLTEVLADANT